MGKTIKGKPHKCKICDKGFTTKGALTRHNNERHNGKLYLCPNCKKCFVRKYRLKTHIKTHIKSCPNEENLCGKIYPSPKSSKDMKENLSENDFLSYLIKAAHGNRQKKNHVYLPFSCLIFVVEEEYKKHLK